MAIQFNETDQWVSVADNSAQLDLPNGDWCIGIWTNVADNTGSFFQYLVSDIDSADSVALYLREASDATPNKWSFQIDDGTNDTGVVTSTSTPGADSTDRLIILQRDTGSNEFQMWFCEPNGTAVKEASAADTSFVAITTAGYNIGRRHDADADRYYGGIAGEFFKGDFALTQGEIESLAAGNTIVQEGKTAQIYLNMRISEATLPDMVNSNDGTRNGSPTTVTHFPVGGFPTPFAWRNP